MAKRPSVESDDSAARVGDAQREYFNKLGIDAASVEAKEKRQAALTRAHELRSFEIEHYWKRATYFWAFQAAIFATFGLIVRAGDAGPLPAFVSALGVLTAIANWLSAEGSKFWQQNWEAHIDMLEDEFEGRLHKTISVPNAGLSYSVSRINLSLAFCFVGFWTVICGYEIYRLAPPLLPLRPIPPETQKVLWIVAILAGLVGGAWRLFRQKTQLTRRQSKWVLR